MEIPTIAFIVLGIIGTSATVGGMCYKIGSKNGNGNGKKSNPHNEIYKRIEQERKDADDNYTSTKLCDERSGNITDKLEEIGKDVKALLTTNGE